MTTVESPLAGEQHNAYAARFTMICEAVSGLLVAIAILGGLAFVVLLTFSGRDAVASYLLDPLDWVVVKSTMSLLPACILLCFVRRTCPYAAYGLVQYSYVLAAAIWLHCFFGVLNLLGAIWAAFGILAFGVGVVPLCVLAALFHGHWGLSLAIVGCSILAIAIRAVALFVGCRAFDKMAPSQSVE